MGAKDSTDLSNTWFRLYNEVVDDPKVQRLSPSSFKGWINLLCIASKYGGQLPTVEDIAYHLRITRIKAETLIDELVTAGLFDWCNEIVKPHNWGGRQFHSDVSTNRVQRFRNKQRNDDVKPWRNVSETPNETDQNRTDTEQNRTEQIIKPEQPSKPKRASRAKTDPPLWSDWTTDAPLSDEFWKWSDNQGFTRADVRRECIAMADYFRSKGEKRADWYATLRNWLRNSRKWSNGNGRLSKELIPPLDRPVFTPEQEAQMRREIDEMKAGL